MVFVIPEDRINPANVAAGNIANIFAQRQGNQELQKALGFDDSVDFTKLNPDQQQAVIKQKADTDFMQLLLGGGQQAQAPAQQPQQGSQAVDLLQAIGNQLPQQQGAPQVLPKGVPPQIPQGVQQPAPVFQDPNTGASAARNNARGQDRPRFSDNQIAGIAIGHPKIADILQSQNRADDAKIKASADRHWEVAKQVFKDSDKAAQGLLVKENSLAIQKQILEDRGMGSFTADFLADHFGADILRTGEGAAFITAGKEFLLGNIKRAGTRPNQWIEQQISKALPKLGQSNQANKMVVEMLDLENRMQRKEISLVDEIADRQEREFGFVRRSLGSEVQKELKKYAEDELAITESRMRDIISTPEPEKRVAEKAVPEGQTRVRMPDGQIGFIPNDQLDAFMQTHNAEVVE